MTWNLDLTPPWESDVALAPLTTFRVGGPARRFMAVHDADTLAGVLQDRHPEDPLLVLGGGSNLLVHDAGFDGDVVQLADYRIEVTREGDAVRLRAGAGVLWDELVAFSVAEGWIGLEALSGIPGTVGAAPIQNIGAYGTELSHVLLSVDVLDRHTLERSTLSAGSLGLGYRRSHFKHEWRDRYIILSIELSLRTRGAPRVGYEELARMVQGFGTPDVQQIRSAVLKLRRRKGMIWSETEADSHGAGSFFLNPIVDAHVVERLQEHQPESTAEMPQWETPEGTKLSAAWLLEQAGFQRGHRHGSAGISSRHVLAIVNPGAARSRDIVALAATMRKAVHERFGVCLVPEPVFVGFGDLPATELLDHIAFHEGDDHAQS